MNLASDIRDLVRVLYRPTQLSDGERICIAAQSERGWVHYAYRDFWPDRIAKLPPNSWYACVATLRVAGDRIRRRREDRVRAHVLLLDDIGTKAEAPDLTPTAVLQTSPGNEQWLYRLNPPTLDNYDAVLAAVCDAGYSDSGAKNPTQLFRLPGSVNKKYTDQDVRAELIELNPSISYSLDDIVSKLNLKPGAETKRTVRTDHIVINDPVMDWLRKQDLIERAEPNDGWYDITCPWHKEHTTGDSLAGYSPLGEGSIPMIRGFHCFHGHCEKRGIEDFMLWYSEQSGKELDSGLSELSIRQVQALVANASSDERFRVFDANTPTIDKRGLPNLKANKSSGLPLERQIATSNNIRYALKTVGLRTRMDMQRHETQFGIVKKEDSRNALFKRREVSEYARRIFYDRLAIAGITNRQDVEDVVNVLSSTQPFSPVCEWVASKPWDGVNRFDALVESVDTDTPELFRMYLRRWLIQCMQAWHNWKERHPKVIEYVLIFYSGQGPQKTRWFNALVRPQDFSRSRSLRLGVSSASDRDSIRKATSTPLTELGEIDTTFSQTRAGSLKAFLSETVDEYRLSYGRSELRFPRTTAFCGTVNMQDFLIDLTGSRRFWPVHINACHPEHGIDIQQLWAEVKVWWELGEQYWLTDVEERQRITSAVDFTFTSATAEKVHLWLNNREEDGVCKPMNATMFMELAGIRMTGARANNGIYRDVKAVLNERLGKAKRVQGVQNAWLVPTEPKGMRLVKEANE